MCKRAGKGLLPRLYRKHKGKCHYCNRELVSLRAIREVIVNKSTRTVTYQIEGEKYHARFATVDHIIDIEFGGTNAEDNVVLSCPHCNEKKNKLKVKLRDKEFYKRIAKDLKFLGS